MTEHAEKLQQAFGFLYVAEVALFKKLAAALPAGAVYVNIGAGVGTSSLAVVEANPALKAYTVDISEGGPFGGLQNEVNAFSPTGLPLPIQILGDSKKVGKEWENGPIDFLFIDGDHSYEGCRGDIEAWRPHVKRGGIIALHDYQKDVWPKGTEATDEAAKKYKWKRIELADTLVAFRV